MRERRRQKILAEVQMNTRAFEDAFPAMTKLGMHYRMDNGEALEALAAAIVRLQEHDEAFIDGFREGMGL